MAEFNGIVTGEGRRFAVLASRFNHHITEKLAEGAMDALVRHGAAAEDVDVVWVPGAWELPFAARRLAATERYNALVVVGAVVRGDTPHFDYVAGEASRGLADASTRVRHPDRLRPAHDGHDGAGRGARRRRARQQGVGRGRRRARDGGPVRAARWRGRGLRRARERAPCRRCTRGTCAAATELERVASQVWDDLAITPEERRVAGPIVRHVAQKQRELDAELAEVTTNWRLERIGAVERCVLRMAAAELSIGETPPRVVIQEAVTLAERFGSAAEREVRQRRARCARAAHGADVVRLLVVNWQDRENPLAGGAEIHLHEIFGRLAAQGNQVTLLCGGWPGCPPRATLDGMEVLRVGTRYTFPFLARALLPARSSRAPASTCSSRT